MFISTLTFAYQIIWLSLLIYLIELSRETLLGSLLINKAVNLVDIIVVLIKNTLNL
jgi:hypothetical protein